jgi:hypothetical protein
LKKRETIILFIIVILYKSLINGSNKKKLKNWVLKFLIIYDCKYDFILQLTRNGNSVFGRQKNFMSERKQEKEREK